LVTFLAFALALSACAPGPAGSQSGPPVPSAGPSIEPEPSPLAAAAVPTTVAPSAVASPSAPVLALPASLRGREWTRLPTTRRVVALTFDGGSGAQGVPLILDTLSREHVPGTFFLTGRWVATYPELARRIAAQPGNAIGNHTMSHPQLTGLSDDAGRREVTDADGWFHDVIGRDPRPLFRFPYGASDARTIHVVNSLGYRGIRWTIDTLGWEGRSGGQSVDSVTARALEAAQPGEIVLMHVGASPDGSTLDADALGRVIDELRRRGYAFVSVREFL
jgi:peptidoglycan/xylan/chitin deacetylase (PgdA/CDA1 family)